MHLDIYYGLPRHTDDVIVSVIAFFTPLQKRRCTILFVYAVHELLRLFYELILYIFHSDVHSAYRVSLTHLNCRHIFTFLFGSRFIVVPYCTRFCSPYGNQGCHKKHNLRIVGMSVIIKIVDLNARVLSLFSSLPPQRRKKRAQIHYCGS